MAKIVLGIGTSHSPVLQLTPPEWDLRVAADRQNTHWYRGNTYSFDELIEARGQLFYDEITPEKKQARFDACQRAIGHLAATLERVSPDVCVIVGDDQHESFNDDNMPAISVYWGATIDDAPRVADERSRAFGIYDTPIGNPPPGRVTHQTDAVLGRHIIESSMQQGFDVAHSTKLPPGRHGQGTIGHAVNFVYRRLMDNQVIPNVPILINTYFPPNQPTMKRCFQFGRALRQAIESWDTDKRVAVIASGGLTHFVVEEDLDNAVIDGLRTNDEAKLTSMPESYFNSGTSEIRNWLVVAGAVADDGLNMSLVDYQPCYRSEAGTGFGSCFAEWL